MPNIFPKGDVPSVAFIAKYGRVGVYCPGLGLCGESAVGNKTIAMNCLRIMLRINSPCAPNQTIQSNVNQICLGTFLFRFISWPLTFSSLVVEIVIEYVSYLWVISWAISISRSWLLCECRGVMCASDVRRITCYHSPGPSLPHHPPTDQQF